MNNHTDIRSYLSTMMGIRTGLALCMCDPSYNHIDNNQLLYSTYYMHGNGFYTITAAIQ